MHNGNDVLALGSDATQRSFKTTIVAYDNSQKRRSTRIRATAINPAQRNQIFFAGLLIFGICQWLLPGTAADASTGSPVGTVLWFLIYAVAVRGIFGEGERATRILRLSGPLIALAVFIIVSTLWSAAPEMTIRRAIEFVGTCGIGLYFALKLSVEEVMETLALVLAFLAAVSLLLIVAVPGLGISEEGWQGAFSHKNLLGAGMLTGIFTAAIALPKARGIRRAVLISALPLFFVILIGSKAAGTWASAIVLFLFVPTMVSARAKWLSPTAIMICCALTAICSAVFVVWTGFDGGDLLELFGKDSTLTGRMDVWRLVIDAIWQKPLLGYGYGVFWGPEAPSATLVYPGIFNHWEPESAHNGFLEIAVNIGLIGEFALLSFVALALRRAYSLFKANNDLWTLWPWCALVTSVVFNLSEATFASYNSIDWILFLVAYFFSTSPLEANVHLDYRRRQLRKPLQAQH